MTDHVVPASERRTGLLVRVAADALVGSFRQRHHVASLARRMPPHITILFPFARSSSVDEALLADLEEHFASLAGFDASLTGVGRFDDFVWLAPEPRSRFVDLITATCARFPAFPPYEGEAGEPIPHLTIATVDGDARADELAALAAEELRPLLPFAFSVTHVSLFEELGDGTWHESRRFHLG